MADPRVVTEPTPLWRYAPVSEYEVPSAPTSEALRGVRRAWKAARNVLRGGREQEQGQPSRERPPAEELADLLPELDVAAAATALGEALGEWPPDASRGRRARVVVGPPGSRTREVVRELARREGWSEISAPARKDLPGVRATGEEWPVEVSARSERPVFVGELHRWLLRNENGLAHLRRFLGRLARHRAPLVMGCDSWAWSFLDTTLGLAAVFGEPLALAPFDATRLAGWLGPSVTSREVIGGTPEKREEIFAPGPRKENAKEAVSAMLVTLASAARGNPGVALELWRRSLFLEPEPGSSGEGRGSGGQGSALWAAPIEESEIGLSGRLEPAERFVLHAILLHGGLEPELLSEVLPWASHDLLRCVRDLASRDLVVESGGELLVAPAAYPAVRSYLDGEGLLVDGF